MCYRCSLADSGARYIILHQCRIVCRDEPISARYAVFVEVNVRNRVFLDQLFVVHDISKAIRFMVIESLRKSISSMRYYDDNVCVSRLILTIA